MNTYIHHAHKHVLTHIAMNNGTKTNKILDRLI